MGPQTEQQPKDKEPRLGFVVTTVRVKVGTVRDKVSTVRVKQKRQRRSSRGTETSLRSCHDLDGGNDGWDLGTNSPQEMQDTELVGVGTWGASSCVAPQLFKRLTSYLPLQQHCLWHHSVGL